MNKNLEEIYSLKMDTLESQFRLISNAYVRLTLDLAQKNETITQLNRKISTLIIQLEEANMTISKLKESVLLKPVAPLSQTAIKYRIVSPNILQENAQIQKYPQKEGFSEGEERFGNRQSEKYFGTAVKDGRLSDCEAETLPLQSEISPQKYQRTKERGITQIGSIIHDIQQNMRNSAKFVSQARVPTQESIKLDAKLPSEAKQLRQQLVGELRQGLLPGQDKVRMKELQAIWQERDREICKMDQLFETLKEKLKDYE